MDKQTRKLALRLFEIKIELEQITMLLLDSPYVTNSDENRLFDSINYLSYLTIFDDIFSEVFDENSKSK